MPDAMSPDPEGEWAFRNALLAEFPHLALSETNVEGRISTVYRALHAAGYRVVAAESEGECDGCGMAIATCRSEWTEQRKCCPDCSHWTGGLRRTHRGGTPA